MANVKKVTRKRRERKNIEKGAAHIRATFNNTIVTITDVAGNAVSGINSVNVLRSIIVVYFFMQNPF